MANRFGDDAVAAPASQGTNRFGDAPVQAAAAVADTKPGLDTFKANMGQVGSVGEYLHAARMALGLPSIDDLMHLPASVVDWAKHGNQPSGGFLSENPVADAFTTATAAVLPPDVASAKSAAGNVTTAAKAGIGGGAKALVEPRTWTGAGVAGMAAHEMGLDPGLAAGVVGGSRVLSSAAKAAKKALTDRVEAAAAAAPVENTTKLDGIAQGFKYKDFASAPADAQETIRTLAARMDTQPATAPVPRTPWRAGSEPPAAPKPTAAPAPSPDTSADLAKFEGEGGAQPQGVEPPPELRSQLNATPEATTPDVASPSAIPGPVEPPAEQVQGLNGTQASKPTKGRMSRSQAQAAQDAGAARTKQSIENRAQFLLRMGMTAEQASGLIDPALDVAERDGLWKQVEQGYTNDKFNQRLNQGGMTQSDEMKLRSVKPTDPILRQRIINRLQELQQPAAPVRRTGMGAMKQYRGSYNPAAMTDEQIAAINR